MSASSSPPAQGWKLVAFGVVTALMLNGCAHGPGRFLSRLWKKPASRQQVVAYEADPHASSDRDAAAPTRPTVKANTASDGADVGRASLHETGRVRLDKLNEAGDSIAAGKAQLGGEKPHGNSPSGHLASRERQPRLPKEPESGLVPRLPADADPFADVRRPDSGTPHESKPNRHGAPNENIFSENFDREFARLRESIEAESGTSAESAARSDTAAEPAIDWDRYRQTPADVAGSNRATSPDPALPITPPETKPATSGAHVAERTAPAFPTEAESVPGKGTEAPIPAETAFRDSPKSARAASESGGRFDVPAPAEPVVSETFELPVERPLSAPPVPEIRPASWSESSAPTVLVAPEPPVPPLPDPSARKPRVRANGAASVASLARTVGSKPADEPLGLAEDDAEAFLPNEVLRSSVAVVEPNLGLAAPQPARAGSSPADWPTVQSAETGGVTDLGSEETIEADEGESSPFSALVGLCLGLVGLGGLGVWWRRRRLAP